MEKIGHIPSLDGIRAIAVLIVFVSHIHYLGTLAPGGFGVTIFFFLSGFIITTLMRVEHEKSGTLCLKTFYLRRVYRIFPSLYITLGLVLLLIQLGILDTRHTFQGLMSSFFHYTNYFVILGDRDIGQLLPGMEVTWSLAVEEHYYLLFPLLFIFSFKRMKRHHFSLVLLMICVLILIWRYYIYSGEDFFPQRIYWATFARMDSILYGAILALSFNPVLDDRLMLGNRWQVLLLAVSIICLALTLVPASIFFREVFRYSLQGLALLPVFYLAISKSYWLPFRILNSRIFVGFGKISYTFYLSHYVALIVTDKYFNSMPWFAVLLAFSLATIFSTAMYFTVERRFSRLRNLLHGR